MTEKYTDICNWGVAGCNHQTLSGKKQLLQAEEMLWLHDNGFQELCEENQKSLHKVITDIMMFMLSKGWTVNGFYNLRAAYCEDISQAHNPIYGSDVGEIQVDGAHAHDAQKLALYTLANCQERGTMYGCPVAGLEYMERFDTMYERAQKMEEEMHQISQTSGYSWDAKSFWRRMRIKGLKRPARLMRRVALVIYKIPVIGPGKGATKMGRFIKKCFTRIDQLKASGDMPFGDWIRCNNMLMFRIGKDLMEDKYDSRCSVDSLNYHEDKLEAERKEMDDRKELVRSMKLEAEDIMDIYEELEDAGIDMECVHLPMSWDPNQYMWE